MGWGVDVAETGSFGTEHAAALASGRDAPLYDWWSFLRAHMPLDVYGADRDGLPVSYFALGRADLQGLAREVGIEAMQKYCVYQNDFFFDAAREASRANGKMHLGGIVIIDMEGLTIFDIRSKVQICSAMAEVTRHLHPERQRCSFIVRASRSFSFLWSIASTILDQR